MRMTFSHLLHSFAGFAATPTAAIVTPWYFVDPAVIRIAIVFLLSLILLGVAVAIFQHSIKAKRKQGDASESQLLQTLEQAIEEGRASLDPSLDLNVAASPVARQETRSPLAELAQQFDKALPEPLPEPNTDAKIDAKTEHNQFTPSALTQSALNETNPANGTGFAYTPPPNPAREKTAPVSLPRLSELRGMRFSQALRELDRAKRSAPANAGPSSINSSLNDALADRYNDAHHDALNDPNDDPINDPVNEALLTAIAPFEPMFVARASAPRGAERCNRDAPKRRGSNKRQQHPRAVTASVFPCEAGAAR